MATTRRHTRLVGGAIAVALVVPLVAVAALRGERAAAPAPSFQRDVKPIVREKCTGCHQTGGIAPFPLETAKQAHDKAPLIAAAVAAGIMPPWPPGPKSPGFIGDSAHTLTAAQRTTLVRWAKAGGPASGPGAGKPKAKPPDVRPGEREVELTMETSYAPAAPKGASDDYRCFLLDPKLTEDVFATSVRILPGTPSVVHHVILFRAPASAELQARQLDTATPGAGWPCFGGPGVNGGSDGAGRGLDNIGWIAAWAPGLGSGRLPDGVGVSLPRGSLVIMQVHYNLLNGRAPDRSRAILTVTPATPAIKAAETMLLPAPIELACASGERGRLCKRDAAVAELGRKYGSLAAFVPAGLLVLCGQNAADPKPSTTSVCDRTVDRPATIRVVAGHMHLLGKSIRLELDPGRADARVLLDIPRWDFHWQNTYVLEQAVDVQPGDVLRVTCRFDPTRRKTGEYGAPRTPRYVLWGEGTTDEMCLGVLQVTRP